MPTKQSNPNTLRKKEPKPTRTKSLDEKSSFIIHPHSAQSELSFMEKAEWIVNTQTLLSSATKQLSLCSLPKFLWGNAKGSKVVIRNAEAETEQPQQQFSSFQSSSRRKRARNGDGDGDGKLLLGLSHSYHIVIMLFHFCTTWFEPSRLFLFFPSSFVQFQFMSHAFSPLVMKLTPLSKYRLNWLGEKEGSSFSF